MPKITLRPPVIQIAIDLFTIDEALRMAEIGVKAGVDWLEAGTPLIVRAGAGAIGALAKHFPEHVVLADYKAMDSGGGHVNLTAQHGGHVMTVCAGACDETVASAVAAAKETGIMVVADTIGVLDQPGRSRQLQQLGVDSIYLHYGADQRRADASRDSTQWIPAVTKAVTLPIGAGTFGIEDGVAAARGGAQILAIGHPLISGSDPEGALRAYCQAVREAYRPAGV